VPGRQRVSAAGPFVGIGPPISPKPSLRKLPYLWPSCNSRNRCKNIKKALIPGDFSNEPEFSLFGLDAVNQKIPPEKPRAVIIGLESIQALQAARVLASRGVPVIAVANDEEHFCCRTKCCERILFARTGLMNTLESLGGQLKQKAVLFPCTDDSVLFVSRNRHILGKWYHIVLADPDVVETMMDKAKFYVFARNHGFSIPATFFLHDSDDLAEAAGKLRYPCVLKPHYRDSLWTSNTTFKAFKVGSSEELGGLFNHYKKWTDCFIAQDWIVGPDGNHFTCNCYFDANSEPIVTFVTRKLRQWPPEMGQGCSGEECRNETVLGETLRLFRHVGFRGLGYLEMKRDDRSGEYFMVEPNIGRPTGRSAIAETGGVELLYTMYCDALGLPLPSNREQKYEGVKWFDERRDFQSAIYYWRKGELTLRDWLKSWQGPKAFAIFSWNDQGPFWGDLQRAVRLFCSKKERKKRDFTNPLG
jgi:D-aspartate ligase